MTDDKLSGISGQLPQMPEEVYFEFVIGDFGCLIKRWQRSPFYEGRKYVRADLVIHAEPVIDSGEETINWKSEPMTRIRQLEEEIADLKALTEPVIDDELREAAERAKCEYLGIVSDARHDRLVFNRGDAQKYLTAVETLLKYATKETKL